MLRITSIDGVRVAEQDVAYGPHPRWPDQNVAYTGIAYVILENGVSGFACETCGYMKDQIRSVASHLKIHNGREAEPLYPINTLKDLIRTVKRNRAAGYKDYMQRSATDLNKRGVKSFAGDPWNSLQVGRLYAKWSEKIKVNIPPQRQPVEPKTTTQEREPVKAVVVNTEAPESAALVKRLMSLGEKLQDLTTEVENLVPDVANALAEGTIDPEVVEKAASWDRIGRETIEKARKFDAAQSLFGFGGK